MALSAQNELEHLGETQGCANHDHDLIHELSRRLDSLWRYDQYIANAEGHANAQQFWIETKIKEQENIAHLKQLIASEIRNDCF